MNHSSHVSRVAALALLASVALAGCATSGNFTCDEDRRGDGCRSTAEVYELTNGYSTISEPEQESSGWFGRKKSDDAPAVPAHHVATKGESLVLSAPIQPRLGAVEDALRLGGDPTAPMRDLPVGGSESVARMPARVMRIWLAPWTDEVGDLHMPGYVYTEIKSRRWSIGGDVRSREQSSFDPNGPWLPSTNN